MTKAIKYIVSKVVEMHYSDSETSGWIRWGIGVIVGNILGCLFIYIILK